MKKIFLAAPFIMLLSFIPITRLKPINKIKVDVIEPSDICMNADNQNFYVAGNRGAIAKVDLNGKVLMSFNSIGADYEGILLKGNDLFLMDETFRKIDKYDASTLIKKSSVFLNDKGGMNQSFEGITYIPNKQKFIAITEKPVTIHEYNEDWFEKNVIDAPQFKEASSITYHNGYLWLLSDEQMMVYQLNVDDYSIIQQWKIPVLNPEGICFDTKENLIILSDDRQSIYTFSPLLNHVQ